MPILTFEQALANCGNQKPKLLMGNGFSQACLPDIFAYNSLFERANFTKLSPKARAAFDALETTDFEIVMRALRKASTLVDLYTEQESDLSKSFINDADGLREVLVSAIAEHHPSLPAEIDDAKFWACRKFLANFGRFYSVNYDLLLYWTIMHEDHPFENPVDLVADDGFRTPDDPDMEYVTWEIQNTSKQNVFYLHGALHLFDAGAELQKYTWCNTGVRINDQVRGALTENLFPLFVAEGSSTSKLIRIKHSDYLSRGLRSLSAIQGSLFVYGHSLGEPDNHILNIIAKGKVRDLYVSIYGDPNSDRNAEITAAAENLANIRGNYNPLNVHFYQAESANVWG